MQGTLNSLGQFILCNDTFVGIYGLQKGEGVNNSGPFNRGAVFDHWIVVEERIECWRYCKPEEAANVNIHSDDPEYKTCHREAFVNVSWNFAIRRKGTNLPAA